MHHFAYKRILFLLGSNLQEKQICKYWRISSTNAQNSIFTVQNKRFLQSTMSYKSNEKRYVHVQKLLDKELMVISFEYELGGKSKKFNLLRRTSDSLFSSLERIKLNLLKVNKKSKKSKKEVANEGGQQQQQQEEGTVDLLLDGTRLDPTNIINDDAWIDGAVLDLNGKCYQVTINSPFVETIRLPACIMKDFVVMPNISLQNCSIDNCTFAWHRKISSKEHNDLLQVEGDQKHDIEFEDASYWLKLSNLISYCPNESDLAHHLRITCWPSDGHKKGLPTSFVSEQPVELGPTDCPFEKRHQLTQTYTAEKDEHRVVSYNILADLYADSDYSRSVLFGHCPGHFLDIDYRRQLLLKEISGYHADIICLQEVDKKEYIKTYEPYMKLVGQHLGVFNTKGGQVAEGVATFYRSDKYELLDTHKTILSELIAPLNSIDIPDSKEDESCSAEKDGQAKDANTEISEHPILQDRNSERARECLSKFDSIREAILSKPELKSRFIDRHTVLQTTLLKQKGFAHNYILVANTHLYFAPDADHVRLLQGSVCTKYLEYIKTFYQNNLTQPGSKIAIILCGDMNSTPDCGLYKLLTTGQVGPELLDWSSNKEEAVEGLAVTTGLRFCSAYENIKYTNFTREFNGCLDYIYYECDGLECESIVPLPSHEDVSAIGGIPSDVFPSDHLALVANLKQSK